MALLCVPSSGQDTKDDRMGGLNLYQGDDASALLQEAFAQAGVDLGGPITPVMPVTRRFSLVDRLRAIKLPLPSFASFSRRKVTPVPNTLMPLASKSGRSLVAPVRELTFMPAAGDFPPFSHNPPAFMPAYNFPKESEIPPQDPLIASPSLRSTKTRISDSVVRVTVPSSPMTSHADNQIVSATKTPNNSFASVWTPTSQYFGGFKPIAASPVNQGSVSTSARSEVGKRHEKSHSLSGEETKRVSFYESLDQEKAAFAYPSKFKHSSKSMDFWKLNDSRKQQPPTDAILKVGNNQSENKLFPMSATMLLEQMARMNSSRSSQDCRNKDLGWCDYSDNYPE